jgi:dienelactone hydrolase
MMRGGFWASAVLAGIVALVPLAARATVRAQAVEYKAGDTTLQGYIAADDAAKGKRPGIVVFPDWFGITDYAEARARRLAALGYVVFIADFYGKGLQPKTNPEALAAIGKFREPGVFQARYDAALRQLRADPRVDPAKLVSMGFCFGARAALGLARAGADLVATVTYHGDVANPDPAAAKNIKGHVLAFWGANDPHVNAQAMTAFADELRQTKIDWEIVTYANTVHSFTNPTVHSEGDAYNAIADRRSWQQTQAFLHEVLR